MNEKKKTSATFFGFGSFTRNLVMVSPVRLCSKNLKLCGQTQPLDPTLAKYLVTPAAPRTYTGGEYRVNSLHTDEPKSSDYPKIHIIHKQ